jgi:hypothetical protein
LSAFDPKRITNPVSKVIRQRRDMGITVQLADFQAARMLGFLPVSALTPTGPYIAATL